MSTSVQQLAPLIERMARAGVPHDRTQVEQAFAYAQEVYGDTKHWTGETVMEHVLGVLRVLEEFQPDGEAVVACLLHHALQTDAVTLTDLEQRFGTRVRKMVSGIHLLTQISVEGKRRSIDDLRLILLSVSDDIRVILITLCDRLYLLNFLPSITTEQRKVICADVLQLYAPVAARLGIYSLKHRLENAVFPHMYPHDAERIGEQLSRMEQERGNVLEAAKDQLQQYFEVHNLQVAIEVRKKQPFSIFNKMRRKSYSDVRQLHDLYAIRVIVNSVEDCYRVLGMLHSLGRPLEKRFKDFVAFPKPNGYQSLHTTVVGLPGAPADLPIEIQVRTKQMHREAKFGIAAHWSYKEKGSTHKAIENVQLHSVLAGQHFVQDDKSSSLVDHIYVLTPRGDVFELPEGATPLDFAFHVHTDLGLCFQGARVNGSMVALDHELENGDVVEIIKRREPHPSSRWMQLLKSSASRSKLKRYLYSQQRPELVTRGRTLVNEELRKHGFAPLDSDLSILRICDDTECTMHQREDILMKIGQGSETPQSLLPRLRALAPHFIKEKVIKEEVKSCPLSGVVEMEGNVPMPTRFAKCCKPNESVGAPVTGLINRNGEVMIHKRACHSLRHANPQRRMKVWWKGSTEAVSA